MSVGINKMFSKRYRRLYKISVCTVVYAHAAPQREQMRHCKLYLMTYGGEFAEDNRLKSPIRTVPVEFARIAADILQNISDNAH